MKENNIVKAMHQLDEEQQTSIDQTSVDQRIIQNVLFHRMTNLSDICNNLSIDYDMMKEFVENIEESELDKEIENLFNGKTDLSKMKDAEQLNRYSKLSALSLSRNIKNKELECNAYQQKSDEYTDMINLYNTKSLEISRTCNYFVEEINSGKIFEIDDSIFDELDKTTSKIMTLHNKKLQLIEYSLRYYVPEKPLKIFRSSIDTDANIIKHELDNVTDVLRAYVEDFEWKVNINRDLNFKVPQSKVIFSNTVKPEDFDNEDFTDYLNIIIKYLRRITGNKVKYYIEQDNKYEIYWVLITVPIQENKDNIDDKN